MISFNDFVQKYKLENKATSNVKMQQVLSYLEVCDVGIYLRDGPFSSNIRIVTLLLSKGTHWVAHVSEIFLLVRMVIHFQINSLKSYWNEMDIVFIPNRKYEV